MRTLLIIGIILVVGFVVYSGGRSVIAGSGNLSSESREVNDFTAVNLSGYGNVTIIQGEREALTIEADDNLLPYIKSAVSQGTLTLKVDDKRWFNFLRSSSEIRYMLTVKSLSSVELSGAGNVIAEKLAADSLELSTNGAGNITIDLLTVGNLKVNMSGAGNITLAGQATTQEVEMSGLGNYQAENLESQTADIQLSGAGNATVWVNEKLDASRSGVGNISYYGTPQMNMSSSGLGNIQSLGDK